MKYLLGFLLVFSAFISEAQQTNKDEVYMFCYFNNNGKDGLHLAYSLDGYKWAALHKDTTFLRPVLSKDSLMRDPCIIKGADGLFHMVWTVSWKQRGIGYASSPDLIHWSKQQFLPVMEQELTAQNCWAPEITYDAKNKFYMIYWATTIPGRFPASDSSGDNNHRIYQITNKDFKTYTPTKLLYDQGFNVIDATIVPDGNQFIMFLKDETKNPPKKDLHIAYSNQLTGGFGKPSGKITGNYWAEGPTTLKIGNNWIVYFDKYRDHKYGAIESTDLKNWTDISDKISVPKGIRHGTIFKVSKVELNKLLD
jgi:hypothetical protein